MLVPTTSPTKPDRFDSADLVSQIVLKNSDAFSYLYDAYSPALFGYIKRRVKSSLHAEEILHDVFIKIWNRSDTYCPSKATYFSWMMAIAKNETIDYLRSKQAKVERLTLPFTATPVMAQDCLNALSATLDVERSLPWIAPEERTIIHLFLNGFTCREIGIMRGMPEGSVKTKMRTAYRKFRALLA